MRWRWKKPIGHNITGRRAARMVDVGAWVEEKKKKKSHEKSLTLHVTHKLALMDRREQGHRKKETQ